MNRNENNLTIEHSQNEIVNKGVIQRLVSQSSVTDDDLVYDIGSGSGAISEALLSKGARVIAIEKDPRRYLECKERLANQDRFELYLNDFLIREFPPDQKYKVFSNIPFFHTADIVNKILFSRNPPQDCYLIVQKEAAEKYAGIPRDTLASLLIKPLFWIDIVYHFKRNDFHPAPSVDVVLLQVEKRRYQLVLDRHYGLYKDFVVYLREGSGQTVKKSLRALFTYSQLKHLVRLLSIDYRASLAELNFTQYLGVFQFYIGQESVHKAVLFRGAEEKMRRRQVDRAITHRTRKSSRTR